MLLVNRGIKFRDRGTLAQSKSGRLYVFSILTFLVFERMARPRDLRAFSKTKREVFAVFYDCQLVEPLNYRCARSPRRGSSSSFSSIVSVVLSSTSHL